MSNVLEHNRQVSRLEAPFEQQQQLNWQAGREEGKGMKRQLRWEGGSGLLLWVSLVEQVSVERVTTSLKLRET